MWKITLRIFVILLAHFIACSVSRGSDILALISSHLSTRDQLAEIDPNYLNFLQTVHQHGLALQSILPVLETGYRQNTAASSESERWTGAIDFAVIGLVDELPEILEYIVNEHLIPRHPLRDLFSSPYKAEDCSLSEYFATMQHSIFHSKLREILLSTQYAPEIYSHSHVSFLNLLYDYGECGNLGYHLAFLFRASFVNFDLVISTMLAANIHETLYQHDMEQARMALKFAVNVRSTDLSHLSYAEVIDEYTRRDLMAMLPHSLTKGLTNRHTESMNLTPIQLQFINHLKTMDRDKLFWLIYNEFYFDPSKFGVSGYEHFWWSLLYSLAHRFDQLFHLPIFPETEGPSNQELLAGLRSTVSNHSEMFLFAANHEFDLFRSVLTNGHYATINFLLEIGDFSLQLPQSRVDLILRYCAIYGPLQSIKFFISLGIFQCSLHTFQRAFEIFCSHGKVSLVTAFLAIDPSIATDEILLQISTKGHSDILAVLLGSGPKFSLETIVHIATEAFRSNNFEVLRTVLNFNTRLGLDLRSLPFLFELFAKDQVEICRLIIDSTFFDDDEEEVLEIVHYACYAAFTLDQPDVLWFLINDSQMMFNHMAQDKILTGALSSTFYDSELLETILYHSGFEFSPQMRANAISLALKSPNTREIVPLLLECPQFFRNDYAMVLALFSVLELDENNRFNEIISVWKPRLTPFVFKSLLKEICNKRKSRYIKTVLETSANPLIYPKDVQISTLLFVAEEGNLDLVKFVMNYGFDFSLRSLKRAIQAAKSHKAIEKYLISKLACGK